MTPSNNLETAVVTFAKVRRWLVAGFGLFLVVKGFYTLQWLTLGLGVVIIAYGMFAPT